MKKVSIGKLALSLMIPLLIGAIAGYFTTQAIPTWYTTLNQPSFNPPNSVFGPVWTTLYLLMGISLYLVWQLPKGKKRDRGLMIFGVQMVLNFVWSFLFFYFHTIGFALIDIIALWICIAMMIISFYKMKPIAAYLNIPYILWVSFATVLNASYFNLN